MGKATGRQISLSAGGHDLNPVSVRVIDKIDAHGWILKTDTAHFLVLFMETIHLIRGKSQMEFFISKIVGFLLVAHPGQFKLETSAMVSKINKLVAPVGSNFFTNHIKADGFLIENRPF